MPIGGGQITTIVSGRAGLPGESYPSSIAIDATTIYWIESAADGSIFAAPLKGGSVRQVAKNLSWPMGLVTDGTTLYWIDAGSAQVMKMPIPGGAPQVVARNQPWPVTIAVDDKWVYWANEGSAVAGRVPGHTFGQVARARK
jgi:hypothetical protein